MRLKRILRTLPRLRTSKCKTCHVRRTCLPQGLNSSTLAATKQLRFYTRILRKGEHLCHQGERLDHLFLVRTGLLKSYINSPNSDELVMGFHPPPNLFGWEGIDSEQLSLSVVALDISSVCVIPLEKLGTLVQTIPQLQLQLMLMISRHVRTKNQALLRTTVQQRVTSFILEMTSHYQRLGLMRKGFQLEITQQDMANYLRIAPETLSRSLKQLSRENIISVSRKKIVIKDREALESLAGVASIPTRPFAKEC